MAGLILVELSLFYNSDTQWWLFVFLFFFGSWLSHGGLNELAYEAYSTVAKFS
jgi:hypothetical protein